MAYNQDIPQATDQISVSQGDLLANFQSLFSWVQANHVTFDITDAGKHKWVTFPRQGVVPAPPFTATEVELYNFLFPTTGVSELYVQKGTAAGIPFTAAQSSGTSGWTYLPSGMKMVWGQDTIPGGSPTKVTTFASVAGFPGFTTASLSIQITRIHNATSTNFIQLDSFNSAQFTARRSTSTTGLADTYAWFAVGR